MVAEDIYPTRSAPHPPLKRSERGRGQTSQQSNTHLLLRSLVTLDQTPCVVELSLDANELSLLLVLVTEDLELCLLERATEHQLLPYPIKVQDLSQGRQTFLHQQRLTPPK